MKAERSSVIFGTTKIDYTIRRTARVKTVSVAVDPEDGVVLTAPRGAGSDRLDGIVRAKATWILPQLRRASDRPPPMAEREFVSGETFLYAGRQHTLRVIVGGDEGASLDHGRLVVRVARGVRASQRSTVVRRLLVDWYRARADERVRELVVDWAKRARVAPSKVSIVEQRRRWGSCSSAGDVRLNWRVVGANRRTLEYVIAHELTHLRHPDHTAAFWRALGAAMPDYERRRAQLRDVGPRLVW